MYIHVYIGTMYNSQRVQLHTWTDHMATSQHGTTTLILHPLSESKEHGHIPPKLLVGEHVQSSTYYIYVPT